MTSRSDTVPEPSERDGVSLRRFLTAASPGVVGAPVDDTDAVAAHILNLNGLLPDDGKLDGETLPKARMPNRDRFSPDAVFKIEDERKAPRKSGTAP